MLSERNKALVERALGPLWADLFARDEANYMNRLLDAARAEGGGGDKGASRITGDDLCADRGPNPGLTAGAVSPKALSWFRPNRYEAAREFEKWFKFDQVREPDATDAFVAGSQWEAARREAVFGPDAAGGLAAGTGTADRQPEPREAQNELSGNPGQLADVEGLVERLKAHGQPGPYEETMRTWDYIRRLLVVEKNEGSLPRDVFESVVDGYIQDCTQAADALLSLSRLLAERSRERDEARRFIAGDLQADLAEQGQRVAESLPWKRQAIEAQTRAETAERRLEEVVGAKSDLFDALWELLSALAEPAQKPERVNAAKEAARRVCLDEHSRQALSAIQSGEGGISAAQGSGDDQREVPAANQSPQPTAEGAVSQERDPTKLAARDLTDEEIVAEIERVSGIWDEMMSDDEFEGHGGSPGEWMVERLGELDHEKAKRLRARGWKPSAVSQEGR